MMKKYLIQVLLIILLCTTSVHSQEFFTDIIVTSSNGLWTDSRAYTTLNDAVNAIGLVNERTLVIASNQNVTDLTIPSNITLQFEREGSITNTGTLTLNTKKIIAPDRSIFKGSGSIIFTRGTVLHSSWFPNLVTALNKTNGFYDYLTLEITEESTITEDVSVGDKTVLKWSSPRNRITVNSGFTLSNVRYIEAGEYQIFAGEGDIDFLDGTILNLSWFKRLRAVTTWVESEQVTLNITKSTILDYNNTIPSNISLNISNGSVISGSNTLTVNGPLVAGLYQIFDSSIIVTGLHTARPEWWGGLPDGSDCLLAFNSAANSLTPAGGLLQLDVGTYILSGSFELPNAVKLRGINTASTSIQAESGSVITGGLITNKTKLPIGQEYFYLEDIYLSGLGATVDSLIYLENIFINSYIRNILARDCTGHALHLNRTAFGSGPIYIENCWFAVCDDHLVLLEGTRGVTFNNCTFENVAANKDCVHLTIDITGDTSQVVFNHPHFEYSNVGVNAIYTNGSVIEVISPEFLGNSAAGQYNVYIDNVVSEGNAYVSYYISQSQQAPTGGRKGIYIKDIDREYTALYNEIVTNMIPKFTGGSGMISLADNLESSAITFADGDTTPSVKYNAMYRTANTAPTEIVQFDDINPGQIIVVYVSDDYTTFKWNDRLRTNGNSFVASKDSIIVFIGYELTAREITRSLNTVMTRTIYDNSATPNIYGATRILMNDSVPTNITRFLRSNEGLLYVLFNNTNVTLIDGEYIKLESSTNYNPSYLTSMLFYIAQPDGTAYEVSRTSP